MSSSAASLGGIAQRPRDWRFYLSTWLPVAVMVTCIALETQSYFGADHTTGPLRRLVEWLFGPVPDAIWDQVHHYIRKCGHLTGYGLLSFTWFRAFWRSYRTHRSRASRKLSAHLLAMFGTFLVASADEFHQSFLPNRTGTPVDVGIDCTGALLVQLLIFLVMLRAFRRETNTPAAY